MPTGRTDEGAHDAQDDESRGAHARGDAADGARAAASELRNLLRQLTAPVVESLDERLRGQVAAHVDTVLDEKVAAALHDRLSILDRAVADLARSVESLERRVASLERHDEASDEEPGAL